MKQIYLVLAMFVIGANTQIYANKALKSNPNKVSSVTHYVGASKKYKSPNALYLADVVNSGDIIYIDAGTYVGKEAVARWVFHDLVIKGVGGMAVMESQGEVYRGKGVWTISGTRCTIENIEFSGAKSTSKNGAGIRYEGAGDITIRNCYFHHNENGILSNNSNQGHVLIEYSEFAYNGDGEGYAHNLYIGHQEKLTFRYNYSHHANIGHNLKSRARENYIYCNRIMDEETGDSSRLIDLSNGGYSIIMGNLLMQGKNAPNWTLVGYGLEGFTQGYLKELYMVSNTLVNKNGNSESTFVHFNSLSEVSNISNNIIVGEGLAFSGTPTVADNNINELKISNMYFVDELNYDYNIESLSPAVDAGKLLGTTPDDDTLVPNNVYVHTSNETERKLSGTIDVGAYEYNFSLGVEDVNDVSKELDVYPNPVKDVLHIGFLGEDVEKITVYSVLGKMVQVNKGAKTIDFSHLSVGVYFVKVTLSDGKYATKKVYKM